MDCINPLAVLNHSAVANVSEIIKRKGGKITKISLINPSGCDLLAFGEHCFADLLSGIFVIGDEFIYIDVEFKITIRTYQHPLLTVSVGIKPNMNYVDSKEFIESQNLYSDIEDFIVDTVDMYLKQQKKSEGENVDD